VALFTISYGVPTDRTLSIRLSDLEFAHNSILRSLTNVGDADIGEERDTTHPVGRVPSRSSRGWVWPALAAPQRPVLMFAVSFCFSSFLFSF
jgi:hypothetical protein